MGSFSVTCAVSGLPIEAGDEVRYGLLTQNPYSDSSKCYIHDLWFPRTWPLRAEYNDYGSVEDVEDGAVQQAWLDAFKIDLKPVGIGDNSVHDVATSKDMSFEHMLTAVIEGRIRVNREVDLWASEPETQALMKEMEKERKKAGRKSLGSRPVPKGVPTMRRVTASLVKAGFQVNMGSWGEGLLVDLPRYAHVRVRAGFGKEADLYKAQKLLKRYATIVRAGEGSYAHGGELLVCPKPGTEGYHGAPRDRKGSLLVAQMMIREDVWQAVCSLRIEDAWWADLKKGEALTVEHFRAGARETWEKLTDKNDKHAGRYSMSLERGLMSSFVKDPIPFSWGLGSSFKWVARKFRLGEMKDEEVQPFLDNAAEYAFLAFYLANVRHMWRPSYSNGPQFGEWEMHRSYLEQLAKVVDVKVEERRKEREDE